MFSQTENTEELAESDPKNIMISSEMDLETIRRKSNKTFYIGIENIGNDFTAIAIRKGSPLLPKFNLM